MAKKVQYSFNFDLNQKKLEIYYSGSPQNAYKEIKTWMTKHNIEHRQGSGYNTIDKITEFQLSNLITDLDKDMPWLFKCRSAFDYYEIGKRKEAHLMIRAGAKSDSPIENFQDNGMEM